MTNIGKSHLERWVERKEKNEEKNKKKGSFSDQGPCDSAASQTNDSAGPIITMDPLKQQNNSHEKTTPNKKPKSHQQNPRKPINFLTVI